MVYAVLGKVSISLCIAIALSVNKMADITSSNEILKTEQNLI